MVRVCDQYLPIKAGGQTKGLLRVIMYLEDAGQGLVASSNEQVQTGSQQTADV